MGNETERVSNYYLNYSDAFLHCKQLKLPISLYEKFNEVLKRYNSSGVKLLFETPDRCHAIQFPTDLSICINDDDHKSVPFFNIDYKLSRRFILKLNDVNNIFTIKLTKDHIIFDNIITMPIRLRYDVYNPLIINADDNMDYVALVSENNRKPYSYNMNPVLLLLMCMGFSCDDIIIVVDDLLNCHGPLEFTVNELYSNMVEIKIPMSDENVESLMGYFNNLDNMTKHFTLEFNRDGSPLAFTSARVPSTLRMLKSQSGKRFYFACDNILMDEYVVSDDNFEPALKLSFSQSNLYMNIELNRIRELAYIWAPIFYDIPDAYKTNPNDCSTNIKCEPRLRIHYTAVVSEHGHKYRAVYQHIEKCKINSLMIWLLNIISDTHGIVFKINLTE